MNPSFQAKDIQRYVGIAKSRYNYIALRIRINAEIEAVSGTGRINLYSYKNLLEFLFAHHALEAGLTPESTKAMLEAIGVLEAQQNVGIFKINSSSEDLKIHFIILEGNSSFLFDSKTNPKIKNFSVPYQGFKESKKFTKPLKDTPNSITPGWFKKFKDEIKTLSAVSVDEVDSFVTLNLGLLKKRINKKIGT